MKSEKAVDENMSTSHEPKHSSRFVHLLKTFFAPLVGITIAAISFFVLWELLKTTSRHDTIEAFKSYTNTSLLLAAFFTLLSYCGIALYDVVAARTLHRVK